MSPAFADSFKAKGNLRINNEKSDTESAHLHMINSKMMNYSPGLRPSLGTRLTLPTRIRISPWQLNMGGELGQRERLVTGDLWLPAADPDWIGDEAAAEPPKRPVQ